MKGLVEGMQVAVDAVGGWVGEGLIEEGVVFGRGESFDFDECLEERRAKAGGRAEKSGQTGAEFFVGKIGAQENRGFGRETVLHVFQKADQDIALDAGEEVRVGEELQLIHS